MGDLAYTPVPFPILSEEDVAEIEEVTRRLQAVCRGGSIDKGFGREGDELRDEVKNHADFARHQPSDAAVEVAKNWEQRLADYCAKRLFLIASEVTEAFEELRSGRAVDETYYPTSDFNQPATNRGPEGIELHKPEGVPSELADTVIRCFDLADEIGIDLAAMIVEKLRYNATRPAMHGRKF